MNTVINYQSVQSSQIFLHSDNADIYYNGSMKSQVEFFLKEPIKLDKNSIECKVGLINAQIPVSWYIINSTNDTIIVSSTKYVFPHGNYNVNQFISQWNTTIGSGWSLTFNSITNKLTFAYSVAEFSFRDDTPNTSLLPVIGFQYGGFYFSSSKVLTSYYPVNFGLIPRLHIKSDTFAYKNIDSYTKGRTRTLTVIPINAQSNGMILYNNFTNFKMINSHKNITSIRIDITDDFRNLIDFNNIDWSLCLQVDVINDVIHDFKDLNDVYQMEEDLTEN
jgi:hypothetical protein